MPPGTDNFQGWERLYDACSALANKPSPEFAMVVSRASLEKAGQTKGIDVSKRGSGQCAEYDHLRTHVPASSRNQPGIP